MVDVQFSGGYHEYSEVFSKVGGTMIDVGHIMSTVRDVQYTEG